jgi:uncharacterized protein (DUF58 family)
MSTTPQYMHERQALRFVDPQVLARIDNLDLLARWVVDGFISGLHRTMHLGFSTDFAEHRAYTPGDDVRRLDWLVYARTDRLYVKTFEAETNADVITVIDVSRSMDFASAGITKLDYAKFLAASITHLGARQRDRVGMATFDDDLRGWIPPAARHRDTILRTLDNVSASDAGEIEVPLERLTSLLNRRSIVVLISDFYATPEDLGNSLGLLGAAGHDVIVVQILDPLELDFELHGDDVLEDLESGERLALDPDAIRSQYLEQIHAHTRALETLCSERRIDYACFNTTMPLDHALFSYLSQRARLARRR